MMATLHCCWPSAEQKLISYCVANQKEGHITRTNQNPRCKKWIPGIMKAPIYVRYCRHLSVECSYPSRIYHTDCAMWSRPMYCMYSILSHAHSIQTSIKYMHFFSFISVLQKLQMVATSYTCVTSSYILCSPGHYESKLQHTLWHLHIK